jgi:hypothetical protein
MILFTPPFVATTHNNMMARRREPTKNRVVGIILYFGEYQPLLTKGIGNWGPGSYHNSRILDQVYTVIKVALG